MPVLNTWKRKALAVLAVALLGIPAALGVYKALEPTRGPWGAGLAAAGFELVYISTAILVLTPELRTYARRVALAAVATSVLLNTLADYAHRVPGGLTSWAQAQRLYDPLALGLSVVESLPLAGLAYAMAELLHRLAEAETGLPAPPKPSRPRRRWAWPAWVRWPVAQRIPVPAMPAVNDAGDARQISIDAEQQCPRCATPIPERAKWLAARRWNRCDACRAEPLTQPAAD